MSSDGSKERITDTDWEPPLPSSDETMWRYIDFTQLMSIIERDQLWFSRVDKFYDPYEGAPPEKLKSDFRKRMEANFPDSDSEEETKKVLDMYRVAKFTKFVNCWHISEGESASMWQLYQNRGKEIAIKSSLKCLRDALSTGSTDMELGKVKYIDYDNRSNFPTDLKAAFFHKRNAFSHEKEFRAVLSDDSVVDWDPSPKKQIESAKQKLPVGRPVSVDVDELIESIVISPVAPSWLSGLVQEIVDHDCYNLDVEVCESKIDTQPPSWR